MLRTPLLLAAALTALTGAAQAQTMSNGGSRNNAGYGGGSGSSFNQPVQVGTRDLSGNRVIVDGVIQDGSGSSMFSRTSGAGDAVAGVGGSATAIGNNLNVIVEGSHNTVVVNARQVNNGAIYAGTSLNGKVTLDGTP
jgi:holdfast attachment protein HfaA